MHRGMKPYRKERRSSTTSAEENTCNRAHSELEDGLGKRKLTPSIGWAVAICVSRIWTCHYEALDEKKSWTDSDVCIGGEKKKEAEEHLQSSGRKMEERAA